MSRIKNIVSYIDKGKFEEAGIAISCLLHDLVDVNKINDEDKETLVSAFMEDFQG